MHCSTWSENLLLALDQRRCISRDLGGYQLRCQYVLAVSFKTHATSGLCEWD